jgi:hypothetical protein
MISSKRLAPAPDELNATTTNSLLSSRNILDQEFRYP